jgi:hypothetical protein
MPSAFAVFRLITNSYVVGASIGNSLGFSPFGSSSVTWPQSSMAVRDIKRNREGHLKATQTPSGVVSE